MAEITYPGVYIEEIGSSPKRIEGVPTSTAAFVGHALKAPRYGRPVEIPSLAEFERLLGGPADGFRLHAALRAYFTHGGRKAIVVPVAKCVPGQADPAPLLRGIKRIGQERGPSLLLAPDAVRLSQTDYHKVVAAMLRQCARLRDRFAILDVHGGDSAAARSVPASAPLLSAFREAVTPLGAARSWGAAYYPWLLDSAGNASPPSGAVAGIYAQVDSERGVWKAPANVTLRGEVADLTVHYTDRSQEALSVPPDGISINAIRNFPGQGIRIWGARTLDSHPSDYRYVPVRRLAIYVEQSIRRGLQPLVFEPNEPQTWTQVRLMIVTFLTDLWRQGGLLGSTPKDAFYVACGLGRTMTAEDVLAGRLIAEVGMAPLKPAEFIILRFRQQVMATE
jgi:phage tail sheath protein FI